jgi:hypothetical protein
MCIYIYIHIYTHTYTCSQNTTIIEWYFYVLYITVQCRTTCFGLNRPSSGCSLPLSSTTWRWPIEAETCRCTLYCNVEYIEIPFDYCCVLTACICMYVYIYIYIYIIHCNNIVLYPYIQHISWAIPSFILCYFSTVIWIVKYADVLMLQAEKETVLQGVVNRLIETGRCYWNGNECGKN